VTKNTSSIQNSNLNSNVLYYWCCWSKHPKFFQEFDLLSSRFCAAVDATAPDIAQTILQKIMTSLCTSVTFEEWSKISASSSFLSYSGWHTLPSHASAETCLTGWSNAQSQGKD